MKNGQAVVLLSGGQDSTTSLYWAKERFEKVFAVGIDYGQRHRAELGAAAHIAALAGVSLMVMPMPVLSVLGDSSLTDLSKPIAASGGMVDSEMPQGLPTSFVPGRNLFFLTAAAAFAVKLGFKHIVTGVCQTDYSGYPDCRREFIDSLETTLTLAMPSSAGPLEIHTPLMKLTKAESVHMAAKLPGCWEALGHTITCYHGRRGGCDECPSECPACMLRRKGFAEAGLSDPARQ